jgi:FAD/FMN-containing dehydrogenases
VAYILREADKRNIAVTFRAAGTSLSGQAISDSVLVIAGEHWKNFEILDEGLKIRLQPGLIGSKVNRLLAPFGRKIGPDPASIHAAMIGGIAANNASGMCCGTADNSYKTVAGIRVILHDGTILDTTDEQSRQSFLKSHSVLAEALDRIAAEVKSNTVLANRIRNKFKIKNTTGYSLNALTDFDNSFDIIEHLMIGSEGTLGFIAGITYRTVVEHPFKASAMMVFPDIINACKAVRILKNQPVSTAELMDRAGLRSVEKEPGLPVWLPVLSEGATALLVETRAGTKAELDNQIQTIANSLETIPKEIPLYFTENPAEYNLYWKIRKGLFPSVGAVRKTGTTVIIEDVAFPIDRLAEATTDLQTLFLKYRYDEAVIFGHALDGNLHFVFTQDFGTSQEVERYERFMADVASLVVEKYDGSLKAEHGTGETWRHLSKRSGGERPTN